MNLEEKILKTVASWNMPTMMSKEKAWAMISEKMDSEPKVIPIYRRFSRITAVAASIAVILTLGWFYFNSNSIQSFSSLKGEFKAIELPDGSLLTLGPASEVNFNSDWSEIRSVDLKGEGFFQVKKGEKFQVRSIHGSVSVIGTSFNVLSRGSNFEVACKTGKVEVRSGNRTRLLTPGLKTKLSSDGLSEVFMIEHERIDSWLNGEYFFDAISLTDVFEEIERQFDVTIKSPDSGNNVFTGPVSLKNIDDALMVVCETMNLQFEIYDKNQVLITNK